MPPDANPAETTRPARIREGAARIDLRITQLRQLFNSLDPSPFHEKDLDADAEEYIVGSAREHPPRGPIAIVIHMPPEEAAHADAAQVQASIRNYFRYREDMSWRELRYNLRLGRLRLAIGLVVLFACVALREVLAGLAPSALARVLAEGLLIGGWVAMWQPVQTFLYGWWPLRETCRLLHRLAQASVTIRPETRMSHAPPPAHEKN